MNGYPIQILTSKQVTLAQVGLDNHGIAAIPILPNMRLIGPKEELKRPFHVKIVIVEGSAQGNINSTR
jgi:hypothetical protein